MINLGHKYNTGSPVAAVDKPGKQTISYPTLYLSNIKGLPFSEDDVDKEMTITAKIVVRRVSSSADKAGKSKSVDLDVVGIEVPKSKLSTLIG